jgi:hypothetical protein
VKYSDSANLKVLPEPARAVVEKEIVAGSMWRVKFQGHYWFAQLYQPNNLISDEVVSLQRGEPVKIIAIQGITLLIRPLSEITKQDQQGSQQLENFLQGSTDAEALNKKVQTTEKDQIKNLNSAKKERVTQVSSNYSRALMEKGDRMIAFASGGAFAGGLIAQVPGAVVGAVAGAIFGWFESSKTVKASEEP